MAGGCRDPRVGTDSVCCSLQGESPRPQLLKIITMRGNIIASFYNNLTGGVPSVGREAAVGVSRVPGVGVP